MACDATRMARTWWTIDVELVSGRGEYWWPRPGRTLIARPGWTFRQLADGINTAFGRWELAHLHEFRLDDGSRIAIPDPWGEDGEALDDTTTRLTRLSSGEVFAYTFDFGDGWDHVCRVGEGKVDPLDVAGVVPDMPIAIFGWGAIPDQHGRRFAGDDGEGPMPPQPDPPAGDLPPVLHDWGPHATAGVQSLGSEPFTTFGNLSFSAPLVWDQQAIRELRAAIHTGDLDTCTGLFARHDASEVAQLAAPALLGLAGGGDHAALPTLRWVINELLERGWPGDTELAAELLAGVGNAPPPMSQPTPVDLEMLAMQLEGGLDQEGTWFLDVATGEWIPPESLDDFGPRPDDLDDADRYVPVEPHPRNEGWHDMAEFVERVDDGVLAEALDRAIHGTGAFRRFGDILRPHEEWGRWLRFRDERQLGRARHWLDLRDFRPGEAT